MTQYSEVNVEVVYNLPSFLNQILGFRWNSVQNMQMENCFIIAYQRSPFI